MNKNAIIPVQRCSTYIQFDIHGCAKTLDFPFHQMYIPYKLWNSSGTQSTPVSTRIRHGTCCSSRETVSYLATLTSA